MTDNELQPPEQPNDPQQPEEQGGADKRQSFVKMLQRIAMMMGNDRANVMKIIKEGDRTADGRESPQLVEVDPLEIPFKKGSMVGLSKVDLRTNTVRAKMSDWGTMDEDVEIGECLSLNEGTGHTSPVEHCFMDQYGNAYIRTANSLYRLDAVKEEELAEALPALPYLEIDPTLPDTPMPSISEVIERNARLRKKDDAENGPNSQE